VRALVEGAVDEVDSILDGAARHRRGVVAEQRGRERGLGHGEIRSRHDHRRGGRRAPKAAFRVVGDPGSGEVLR